MWGPAGQSLAFALALAPGESVLDVCAGAIEEFGRAFFEVVARHAADDAPTGPVSRQGYDSHPLRRIETPDLLASWLSGVGCESVRVQELSNHIPATEEFEWNLVLGSGFHGALSGMDDATVAQVRSELAELTTARGIDSVDATTLVATGVRAA